MKKCLIPILGQETNKMSPDHLIFPENKEAIKDSWDHVKRTEELIQKDFL